MVTRWVQTISNVQVCCFQSSESDVENVSDLETCMSQDWNFSIWLPSQPYVLVS